VSIFKEKLVQSGEKARLKELLNSRLTEVGWKGEVVHQCQGVIQRDGLEKVTLDSLVRETSQRGRDTVPSHVKAEMLEQIRKSLSKVQRQG
jgi:enhancer of yellow 2 transcription factor